MDSSNRLKVGDFVKHRLNPVMVFQVADILDPVDPSDPRMIRCVEVRKFYNYLESDVLPCDLSEAPGGNEE